MDGLGQPTTTSKGSALPEWAGEQSAAHDRFYVAKIRAASKDSCKGKALGLTQLTAYQLPVTLGHDEPTKNTRC